MVNLLTLSVLYQRDAMQALMISFNISNLLIRKTELCLILVTWLLLLDP